MTTEDAVEAHQGLEDVPELYHPLVKIMVQRAYRLGAIRQLLRQGVGSGVASNSQGGTDAIRPG